MHTQVISEAEFKTFIDGYQSYMHYFHDPLYYDHISKINETHLLGLYEDDILIGVSMLSATSVLKRYRLFTSHTGPLIKDFTNQRLYFFLKQIDAYAKANNALQMIHSPYRVYQFRDYEGEVKEGVAHNREIMHVYQDLGFTHHGFTKQLITEELLRYQAVIDIDKSLDQLKEEMDSTTRYNTRQIEQMPLRMKFLEEDEYDRFIKIYKDTEERIGFDPVPEKKLRTILNTLKDRMFLTLTYVDLDEYLSQLNHELEEYESRAEILRADIENGKGTKGTKKRLNQEQQQIDSRNSRIKKIKKFYDSHGNVLELSTAMYYYNNHEMVYLFSGSNPELSYFMGTNFATWEMIKKAQDLGLKRFNLSGLTGDFTENAQDFGVYRFKKGYHPVIEELPGTFDKIYKHSVYKIAHKLGKI
jgi:alanine adding enzyme